MTQLPTPSDFSTIRSGFDPDPKRSLSLRKEAYTEDAWFAADRDAVLARSWQWVCHVENLRTPGSYVTTMIADRSIAIVRDKQGQLVRAPHTGSLEDFDTQDICLNRCRSKSSAALSMSIWTPKPRPCPSNPATWKPKFATGRQISKS